ncbi:MAG: hypothetical protein EZS28_006160 [Streblomastix strix]|uniref:Uncharacterized protein n=1 Tax=Streblomastix strix TaxID=222440 RepID=A0A5J4WU46_9EUKA|nr:MAG: hypothetical protein EZS28_006160 [Streblomastix strix]
MNSNRYMSYRKLKPIKPSADDSYKTLPNAVVRDKQINDYFNQKAVYMKADYQDWQLEQLTLIPSYITFDFETFENIIKVNTVIAQLEPLSVASAVTVNDQISTLHFAL